MFTTFKVYLVIKSIVFLLISLPKIFWYISFIMILAFVICKEHLNKKKQDYKKENMFTTDFHRLDFYYIKNVILEIIKLIILLSGSIGLLFILRSLNIGKTYNLWEFYSQNSFNLSIVILVVILVGLYIYSNIIKEVLKDTIYKIYLYLYQYNKLYELFYVLWDNYAYYLRAKKLPFHNFFANYGRLTKDPAIDLFADYDYYVLTDKITITYLTFLNNKAFFHKIFNMLYHYIEKYDYILILEQVFFKYIWKSLIFSVLLFDLHNNELRYFYYVMVLFLVINTYQNIRQLIGEYDMHEIDYKLVQYFYKEKIHAKILKANVEEYTAIIYSNPHAEQLYVNYEEKLKEYIEREYRVDYIDINFKKSYEPYNMRLLLIAIGVLYINFCYHSSLINNIIISIPLVIAIVIYEISYKYYKTIKYNRYFLVSYIILIIISIMGFIWIYLTRHNFNFIRETIWSMGIIIEQSFTLTEKRDFLVKYLFFIINKDTILTIEQKLYIYEMLKNINVFQYITESTTMEQIKEYCNNLTKTTDQLLNWQFSKKKTILESVDIKELYNIIKDEQIQKNILNKAFTHIREYFNFDNEAKITIGGFIAFIIYRLFVNRNKSYLEDVLLIEYPKRTSLDIINFILKFIRELFH